jgi:diguanylate cyclase (GGDEF)-like protein/putative nucleotidyltransferase with HDIG domain
MATPPAHPQRAPRSAAGKRPALLALVYGVFLVLVGVTASALVAIAGDNVTNATLSAVVDRDHSLVELFVSGRLRESDLADGVSTTRIAELQSQLAALTGQDAILRIEIRVAGHVVVASNEAGAAGSRVPASVAMTDALAGRPTAALVPLTQAAAPAGRPLGAKDVVQEFLPIMGSDGTTMAVVALWRDGGPLVASIDATRRDIMVVTLFAAILLAAILFLVFRAAHARLIAQQLQLVDATRRDALTGLLNHGSVVGLLAEQVESARAAGTPIGIALIDVDNFRLFNDNHGHAAGDEILLKVAGLLATDAADGTLARYGPDELLLVRPGIETGQLELRVASLMEELESVSVQFGDSEQLPISVSAGIASYPTHGDSVTELLSAVAVALGEARASGGGTARVAASGEERKIVTGTYDVLQGLVIAVDTKDRYTKRHSEDVARYAVFLAEQIGLDEDARRTIHLAGLLHDIGKIGIPDTILRKPNKLTADEYDIFKQHVTLGDAIVRDVPQVDTVRDGIRHHHERWDGRGYLEGLEADEIPLIARVLAVADAFSAMTTHRPYRRALPVEEALKRLGDAAGTQLEEPLVVAFIHGLETVADAPMPGVEPAAIWRPELWVA